MTFAPIGASAASEARPCACGKHEIPAGSAEMYGRDFAQSEYHGATKCYARGDGWHGTLARKPRGAA